MKRKLTPKQQRFADEYIKSGNAADAARKAGYSKQTARTVGQQNLTKLDICPASLLVNVSIWTGESLSKT